MSSKKDEINNNKNFDIEYQNHTCLNKSINFS